MPVHVPAPAEPTDRCPKCDTKGVPQQTIANMTSYLCPKCGARWMATSATPRPARALAR